MFTIGIFSTHIPYIAFVVFYAYFLLTGVNKAVAGEIQVNENIHQTEFYAQTKVIYTDEFHSNFHWNKSDVFRFSEFKNNLFRQKINYPENPFPEFQSEFYSISLFSRPPPVA